VLRLLRPKQWTKNLLLFAAPFFAGRLLQPADAALALLGFVAFCLASSSVYVVNDWVDVERDRLHPEKRQRPIASGRISPTAALVLAVALTLAALGLAAWLGPGFLGIALLYVVLSHFYSFVGKHIVVFDTLLVAIGFVIRAVAGAIAIDVDFSDWFVLCTLFVALFISVSKRRAELVAGGDALGSREVLNHYTEASLTAFTVTAMAAAILSYSLYVQDVLEKAGAHRRLLLLTVPLVIAAIFRYFLLVERDGAGEKPEEILLSDRPLQLAMAGFLVVAVLAFYGDRW
jgi:4-hydroxybenzoate polyprenyltransferase